jgi:hypothetical protein
VRRTYFLLSAAVILGLAVSVGAVWWEIVLDTGATIFLTGIGASAVASSLVAAAAASFGVGLVVRGVWRRIATALQGTLMAGAASLWFQLWLSPRGLGVQEIETLTGISGELSAEMVTVIEPTGFLWVGIFSAGFGALVSVVGAIMPEAVTKASRYVHHDSGAEADDPVVAWDRLSDGEDPTKR